MGATVRTGKGLLHYLRRATDVELLKLEFAKLKRWRTWMPGGHFYSPIPSVEEIRKREEKVFARHCDAPAGLELHEREQRALLERFGEFYKDLPFGAHKKNGRRYYFDNTILLVR